MGYLMVLRGHEHLVAFWVPDSRHYNIVSFEILWTIGDVAYELALPPDLSVVHRVFHVAILWCYISDESHVILWDSVQLYEWLSYIEEPISILARDVRWLYSRVIPVVKVE